MDLHSIKKYASQVVPFLNVGKSAAHQEARKLVKAAGAENADVDTLVAGLKDNALFKNDKTVAHIAVKLLTSRDAIKNDKVGQVAEKLLAKLDAPNADGSKTNRKSDALHQVFSHYQHKKTQRNVAAVALGASGIATIGAFAGAGPAGLIPLLVGVLPSATALAKSRKAHHRLALLQSKEITAKSFASFQAAKGAEAAPTEQGTVTPTEAKSTGTGASSESTGAASTDKPATSNEPVV